MADLPSFACRTTGSLPGRARRRLPFAVFFSATAFFVPAGSRSFAFATTIVFFLARMGVVTGSFLLKYFKYAVLIITIIAAIVSPGTDAMSTIIYAVPMLALYIVSIAIAFIFQKRKRPAEV